MRQMDTTPFCIMTVFFDAGDLVQFDMKVKDQTRRATNTRLLVEKAAMALPDILRHESRDVPLQSAQVTDLASRRRGYGAGASETQMASVRRRKLASGAA